MPAAADGRWMDTFIPTPRSPRVSRIRKCRDGRANRRAIGEESYPFAVRVRIEAPNLDFYVDVRLRNFEGRCLAVAQIAGDPEVGVGMSATEAVTSSLSSLGPRAAALMSDPRLWDVTNGRDGAPRG
jgi:hypothetical protein